MRPGVVLWGPGFSYSAGDEFTVPFAEAAMLLKGKGRRCVEVLEVVGDAPRPPKLP